MRCFHCLQRVSDPEELFDHLKTVHKIRGNHDYKCCLCASEFDASGSFKTHVRNCYKKNKDKQQEYQPEETPIDEELEIYHDIAMEYSDSVADFKQLVRKFALDMVLKMSSNMNIPRNLVFNQISDFQTFINNAIIHGLKTVVIPGLKLEDISKVKRFIKVVERPFQEFDTESKLDSVLYNEKMMDHMKTCILVKEPIGDPLDDPCDDSFIESDQGPQPEEKSMVLMPIKFKLQKFLELPNVFEKMMESTEIIRRENKLNHFINGNLWKEKMKHFDDDQTVIPYFLYFDGAQVNNSLGPHCRNGLLDFNYITLPTIPTEYQSRLENIFVMSISPDNLDDERVMKGYPRANKKTKDMLHIGIEGKFNNVIEELSELADEGIAITINGETKRVYFVCGCFIGDNKESNTVLSFVGGFRANYYCRYCRLHRTETQKTSSEVPEERRNRQNYFEDVLINDSSKTGIKEYSPFNEIPLFHVTDSSGEDNTHLVDEGTLHYDLLPALHYFIYEKEYFSLQFLNERVKSFDYVEEEKRNIPMPILEHTLKSKSKFKMTASEMFNFAQNLIFIIGDLVPRDDPVWKFVLKTINFFDLAYLPCYDETDIAQLAETITLMNDLYQQLFNETLKPVHHIVTHYPEDTQNFGPIRYLKTIRCEGKHKPMKNYCKSTCNRMNICFSVGKKDQYSFAYRLAESRGLEDTIDTNIYGTASLLSKVYYDKLKPSQYKEKLTNSKCSFANNVNVNGIVFRIGLWLPDSPDSGNHEISKIMEICDVVVLNDEDVSELYAVCKVYNTTSVIERFNLYCVDISSMENAFTIVNVRNYLSKHHYPVNVYKILNEKYFRCKRF